MYRRALSNLEGWVFVLGSLFLLSACSMNVKAGEEDLPSKGQNIPPIESIDLVDRGPAAELENMVWLNVDQPLQLKELRGKVVLLDFWTFG